ncbi:MAG: hypothetical protein Q4F11_00215 [Eubacteriales bacterium]|nr:hypothetical protein [Eubacteriales bacterium]
MLRKKVRTNIKKSMCALLAAVFIIIGGLAVSVYAKAHVTENVRPTPVKLVNDDIWSDYYGEDEQTDESDDIYEEVQISDRVIPERTLNTEAVPYDGRTRAISCWGDSMMFGCNTTPGFMSLGGNMYNISYATTPAILQRLTGLTTYNMGVNGETSKEIAIREGGLEMVTDRDIFIEGSGIAEVRLRSSYDGDAVWFDDYSGYNFNSKDTNIVVINGKSYYMTNGYDGESQILYGTDVYIPAGSVVKTLASVERKDDILILEIGSNGGWNNNYDELVEQYDAMLQSVDCKYYIIVGDTDDPKLSADANKEEVGSGETPWEKALKEAYGDHFLNLRLYLIQNGLSDCGLEATQDDLNGYEEGIISQQLRSDWTHFNAYGYYSKAVGIYEKGKALGYWE